MELLLLLLLLLSLTDTEAVIVLEESTWDGLFRYRLRHFFDDLEKKRVHISVSPLKSNEISQRFVAAVGNNLPFTRSYSLLNSVKGQTKFRLVSMQRM